MPQQDLKGKMIGKTRETEGDSLYRLNDVQEKEIAEAREQVRNQQTLTGEEAGQKIDEWLNT